MTAKLRQATLDALHDRLQTLPCDPTDDGIRELANIVDDLIGIIGAIDDKDNERPYNKRPYNMDGMP